MTSKFIQYDGYYLKELTLKYDGIFAYLRHPMQSGFLSVIFFGHNVYTVDKLIFSLLMGGGILLGIYFEEKRMAALFSNY